MDISKSIFPIGFAVILVSVMAIAPIIVSTPSAFAQISISPVDVNVLAIGAELDPFLYKINPNTGAIISSVEITLDGSFSGVIEFPEDLEVRGGTGVEFNPTDGKIYALLKLADPNTGSGLTRHLVTINPGTGIATLVGDTGVKKIASLTFNDAGTLFAVNVEPVPGPGFLGPLVTISTVDGSVVELCLLDLNGFGSALSFNPTDGKLYYAKGDFFQRIDNFNVAGSCEVTNIKVFPGDPTSFINPNGMAFFNSQNTFLIVEFEGVLFSITAAGDETFIGIIDAFTRDLTIIDNTEDFKQPVSGEMIPVDTTSLLVAGAYTTASWMIPVIMAAAGFGILFTLRKNH